MIGIFYGACIINKSHLIISIDKTRKQYIDHISDLIESVVKVKPHKKPNGSKVKLVVNNPEAVRTFESSWKQKGIRNYFCLYV